MNNNMNIGGGMNNMSGPGGGMPLMNNGIPGGARPMPVNDNQQRSQLNTYIYEYFLRNEMYDCARALIQSEQPINVLKNSPGRRRDNGGNALDNGISPDAMDNDSKDDLDSKRPDDLPAPNLPKEIPESCFLMEWWCLFWDMFNAQRGKGEGRSVQQYVAHTQHQSRMKQENQQRMLQNMSGRADMTPAQLNQLMRNGPQAAAMGNDVARRAMMNSRNATPQMMQQYQQLQNQPQKPNQMSRDGSDGSHQRPQSPGKGDNAPSPSKRQRLENGGFNGQPNMMVNGRQPSGEHGGPASNIQATQMLLTNGIQPGSLTPQQYQQFQAAQQQQQQQAGQGKPQSLAGYANNIAQHQASQSIKGLPANAPQGQGSPMMVPGQNGANLEQYYNADGAAGMRPGQAGAAGSNGNLALQDYQMQLMLLEQQNKKRLMMARQEQECLAPRDGSGGPGGPGPNGQPFQGTSPQGPRSGSSPNPNDMKRGTPQMNAAGIPSPLPDGQSRGSPGAMTFMAGQMPLDPNMAPKFFQQMNGMDGNMGNMQAGMRAPSSHPTAFPAGMNPQMMNMARQQTQAAQAAGQQPGWQGPNGTPMMQNPSQGGGQPQAMNTPQQRAMPPPSAPAAGAPANGRTQPSSPQQNAAPPTPSQTNKANPKGKKDAKPKRNAKKGAATGATPAADAAPEPATPTPATPITPIHPTSLQRGQNGAVQNATNGQTAQPAPAPVATVTQTDPTQNFGMDDNAIFGNMGLGMDFANPSMGSGDVLQDFDFDSFLHQDNVEDNFAFDSAFNMEGGEVGAE